MTEPSYQQNVKKASRRLKKMLLPPAKRAAYWIDYVLDVGAEHLKPAGNHLNFWQYYMLDVLLFCVVVVTLVVVFAGIFMFRVLVPLSVQPLISAGEKTKKE